jgi:cell filamentation protein
VTDKASDAAEREARAQREGDIVAVRIKELAESPLSGRFDAAHLKAVHAYLFQDLPEHQPGVIRRDTDGWHKVRELEGREASHVVHYARRVIEAKIDAILRDFGRPATLKGLRLDEAAARLAGLYGDLDHAHAFYEGNSRSVSEPRRAMLCISCGMSRY